jgi:hypothetical protein
MRVVLYRRSVLKGSALVFVPQDMPRSLLRARRMDGT